MKRLTFALIVGASLSIILAPPFANGADIGTEIEVKPPGGVSCASWTQGRDAAGRDEVILLTQEGVARAEREGWVSGYLTALNVQILPDDRGIARDLTEGIDRESVMALIDIYCAENPLRSLLHATASVVPALANRWLAAHPPIAPRGAEEAPLPAADLAIPQESVLRNDAPRSSGAAVSLSELLTESIPESLELPPAAAAPPVPPAAAATVLGESASQALAPPLAPAQLHSIVAADSGGAMLQIGSYRSNALAAGAWEAFRVVHREIVHDLASNIEAVDLGPRGIYHRLRIGPFPDNDAANGTCALLKARGADCFSVAR